MTTVVMNGNTIVADRKLTALETFEGERLQEALSLVNKAEAEVPHYGLIKSIVVDAVMNPPSETTKIFDVSGLDFNINGDKALAIGTAGSAVVIQALANLKKGDELFAYLSKLISATVGSVKLNEDKMIADMSAAIGEPVEANALGISPKAYFKALGYGCCATLFLIVGENYNYVVAQRDATKDELFIRTYSKDMTVSIGSGAVMMNLQHNFIVHDLLTMVKDIIGTSVYKVKDEVDESYLIAFIKEASLYDPMTGTETNVLKF